MSQLMGLTLGFLIVMVVMGGTGLWGLYSLQKQKEAKAAEKKAELNAA